MSDPIKVPAERVVVESMGEHAYDCKHPCSECPFSKTVKPGTLGGSPVDTYVGQIEGPFHLACHMAPGYTQENGGSLDTPQCAGAAIFRANLGLSDKMPDPLLKLPPGDESFASHAEFVAHHCEVPVAEAESVLTWKTPADCLRLEMEKLKTQGRIKLVKREAGE